MYGRRPREFAPHVLEAWVRIGRSPVEGGHCLNQCQENDMKAIFNKPVRRYAHVKG